MDEDARRLKAVIARHRDALMAMPGVAGVGEGREAGQPCILVYAAREIPELPTELEGLPVVRRAAGPLRAD